ncbi:hypothetical protein BDV34DRAFT_233473 [Aspergillus parasiticus]|uniref:Uncharacterized protein n=1 Tax=Aspergillus parasiticus TaxID=5067 RepID=A0A5N6DUM2_ASPPA|nr:hypothetical protein BDV34DRAFT_233473 [Aspergillus parasiticus]
MLSSRTWAEWMWVPTTNSLSKIEKRLQAECELRQQRGYDANAHEQEDSERSRGRALGKTKERYRNECKVPEGYEIGDGHPAPTIQELKQFFRWLIKGTQGRLAPDGIPTRDTEIARNDRDELYRWIDRDLVKKKLLSTITKPKYNFQLRDFERAIIAFWTINDPFFISGQYRVEFHFITIQFLCTGARVSSFTPASEKKKEDDRRGLRYKQFVKNNKDPENTDCDEPIYSGALYLLALALADNALYRFSSPEEVFGQRILERDDGLYQKDFRKILANDSYFITATVHAIHRALGKTVRNKYSSAHVAQILTHHCSGVDVFNILRGRLADHTHIEYFQGYGQFHEHGLPRQLPIEEKQKIYTDPHLYDEDTKHLKYNYDILKRKTYTKALQRHQTEWVRNQEHPEHTQQTTKKQAQYNLIPKLGRLAAVISSKEPLSFDEKIVVVKDSYTQYLRDFDVVYRPGEKPVEGQCPVKSCGKYLETLQKSKRSNHIHSCIREEVSHTKQIPPNYIKRSPEFKEHCANHLPSITSQHYKVIDNGKSAACRITAFNRSTNLRKHLDNHISEKSWPSKYSDPLCSHVSTDKQYYQRHVCDVNHYNKANCVPSEKTLKKRSSSEIDKESIVDGNSPKRRRRPWKQQKNSLSLLHTNRKDLKIIIWEPPTTQSQAMLPPSTEAEHESEECLKDPDYQAVNHCEHFNQILCTSPDDDSIRSALSDVMNVTDSPCPAAIGSVPSATVIDPRILDISTTNLASPEEKHQHLDECDINCTGIQRKHSRKP